MKWLKNIGVSLDQLLNTITGGDPDETISSRAAKARNEGRAWGCWLCGLLDRLDPKHCDNNIEADRGSNAVIPD